VHDPNHHNRAHARPSSRCLRHHVWMAYCGDCRDAHAPLVKSRRETASPQR